MNAYVMRLIREIRGQHLQRIPPAETACPVAIVAQATSSASVLRRMALVSKELAGVCSPKLRDIDALWRAYVARLRADIDRPVVAFYPRPVKALLDAADFDAADVSTLAVSVMHVAAAWGLFAGRPNVFTRLALFQMSVNPLDRPFAWLIGKEGYLYVGAVCSVINVFMSRSAKRLRDRARPKIASHFMPE